MTSSNDSTPSIPTCAQDAERLATLLHAAVLKTPFPDLSANVENVESATQLAEAAVKWAKSVEQAHSEVVQLFPKEAAIEVEFDRNPLDVGAAFLSRGGINPPSTGRARPGPRARSLHRAADVLAPLPERFRNCMASAFPFNPGSFHGEHDPGWWTAIIRDLVVKAWETEGWDGIRRSLSEAHLVVWWKSLGLVSWVRSTVHELRSAALPTITFVRTEKYDNRVVRVSLAGNEREIKLPASEFYFLKNLASEDARADRSVKRRLLEKLPELAPFIEARGTMGASTIYAVTSEVASRIDCNSNLATKLATDRPTPKGLEEQEM